MRFLVINTVGSCILINKHAYVVKTSSMQTIREIIKYYSLKPPITEWNHYLFHIAWVVFNLKKIRVGGAGTLSTCSLYSVRGFYWS